MASANWRSRRVDSRLAGSQYCQRDSRCTAAGESMNYVSVRIEGSIFSPDILDRLEDAAGQKPVDFGLDSSIKVKDEIARAWADAQDYWRIFHRKLDTLKPDSPATTETRNLWVVPLLGLLGYQL